MDLSNTVHGGTMLVISREINQSLMIGDDLQLQVLKIRASSAHLRVTRTLIGRRMTEELFSGWLEKDRPLDLGDKIACAVVEIQVNPAKIRLGIDAPREVSIHRKEVYDAIRRTQQ
jgi:carbon storage regulator